jgi:rhodanese-related sulfurtransferase
MGFYLLYQKGYILKNFEDVDVKTAYERLQVDTNVRTPEELKKDGKIKNSLLVPLQVLEKNIDKLERFKDTKIFVYCRSGSRSIAASRILANHGYHPYNINGGINTWKGEKLPVE